MVSLIQNMDKLIQYIDNNDPTTTHEEKESSSSSILMIPGPIEFHPKVYQALNLKTESHVSPVFIEQFGQCLEQLKEILLCNKTCQPFVLSGGGTLGWDCLISSLLQAEAGDRILILNTGYFSDSFRTCAKAYQIEVDEICAAAVGDGVSSRELEEYLLANQEKKYAMIGITHVDTSVAIVNDVQGLAQVIHKHSPNSLIAVDGVCSFAAHEFRFSKWGIDCCMSASQKAFGAPPGLCILALSERALNVMQNRKSPVHSYYSNLLNWLPIMQAYEGRRGSYFSTPNVNLIIALNASCKLILRDPQRMEKVFVQHARESRAFEAAMIALGLTFVAVRPELCADTISAIYFPENVNGKQFLSACKERGCIFAGGLHSKIKSLYFRVGHMSISVDESSDHMFRCVKAIEYALNKCGYQFESGIGVRTYNLL